PPAKATSPYSSTSAFAGNPLLISLERLVEQGLVDSNTVTRLSSQVDRIDYEQANRDKFPLLWQAAQRFLSTATLESRQPFENFCRENAWWLEDYVLFDALREKYGGDWSRWPTELARRDAAGIDCAKRELSRVLASRQVLQFFFWEQWRALREYCAQKSIRVVGDIAIFVDYDSADVWAHRELFRLKKDDLQPEAVSGVPPDYFSATGQRWGNPLYNWDAIRATGYQWWVQRLRWATETCDFIRLDHFRGFAQFWEIPADEPTAVHGRWVDGPGDEFFNTVR